MYRPPSAVIVCTASAVVGKGVLGVLTAMNSTTSPDRSQRARQPTRRRRPQARESGPLGSQLWWSHQDARDFGTGGRVEYHRDGDLAQETRVSETPEKPTDGRDLVVIDALNDWTCASCGRTW